MTTPPAAAGNLPLPRWAYVPGESEKSSADYDTLAQITALVPPRFGGYVPARHPALRYGLALIAPHFIVEDMGVASIAQIRDAYATTNLKEKLARWHKDVDNAFHGWNDAWLDPDFRNWDISEYLAYIRVPVAILQGADDQYGTMRQVEIAQEECYCPVDVTVIPGAGHQPHREAPGPTLDAISEFANAVLHADAGSQGRAA